MSFLLGKTINCVKNSFNLKCSQQVNFAKHLPNKSNNIQPECDVKAGCCYFGLMTTPDDKHASS